MSSRRDDIPKDTGDKTRSYFKEIRNYIILYSETFLRCELFLLLLELLSMKNFFYSTYKKLYKYDCERQLII